jgi:hypothetical protein
MWAYFISRALVLVIRAQGRSASCIDEAGRGFQESSFAKV